LDDKPDRREPSADISDSRGNTQKGDTDTRRRQDMTFRLSYFLLLVLTALASLAIMYFFGKANGLI